MFHQDKIYNKVTDDADKQETVGWTEPMLLLVRSIGSIEPYKQLLISGSESLWKTLVKWRFICVKEIPQ